MNYFCLTLDYETTSTVKERDLTMIKEYFQLTKPGIIFGNAVTCAGGFALASKGHIDFWLFFSTLLGLSLLIASGCVSNNYTDRKIDEKMARCKNRALVTKVISEKNACLFAALLGLAGVCVLAVCTNFLTLCIALFGFFVYIVLYGIWKRRSSLGTVIGSIAGGVPPVVGYTAVSNHLDLGALLLFLIIALWQMPHFFAIAIYRLKDYIAAEIPVLPVSKGIFITKVQMLAYIIAFTISALMLTFFGYMGYAYLAVAALLGSFWLFLGIKGFTSTNDTLWARKMFLFSLVTVMVLCALIPVDVIP